MERIFTLKNGEDLQRVQKWVNGALLQAYYRIKRANHGKLLCFEAQFTIKERDGASYKH